MSAVAEQTGSSSPRSAAAPDLAERARAIVPELRRLTAEAERLRRLPKESLDIVKGQGLLRTIQPKVCGGYATSMRTHLDVVSTVAEGCSATAWVLGVAHAHSWMMGHLSRQAQQEVYGENPDTLVSAVIGPRGRAVRRSDGSVLLNGFWPFASGSEHASWLLLGSEVFDESGTMVDEADLLVPASAVEIKDDWYAAGLQGTGSCSIAVKDLEVPAHRYLTLPGWLESETPNFRLGDDEWLTRAQPIPVLGLCISSASLGIARQAIAEFRRLVPGKKIIYTGHISDDWIPTQTALGHAAEMIHAGELVLYKAADDIDHFARIGQKMPMEIRARIRMDCSYAVRLFMDAVDKLFIGGGASALSLKNSLQRASRDLHAINMHALLLFDTSAEIYGRVLLGKGTNTPVV